MSDNQAKSLSYRGLEPCNRCVSLENYKFFPKKFTKPKSLVYC